MATVETVRGPVDTGDLGTTLMHEHVFVLTPDIMANYGDEYCGTRRSGSPTRSRSCAACATWASRRSSTPPSSGSAATSPASQRIDAEVDLQHRRRHRPLHVRRDPALSCTTAAPARCSAATSRWSTMFVARHPRGHRRDRGQGGVPQGRRRGARACTPGVRRGSQHAIAATHVETGVPITVHTNGAHQTGRLALDLYEQGGRRPDQGRGRARGRQQRPRLPA